MSTILRHKIHCLSASLYLQTSKFGSLVLKLNSKTKLRRHCFKIYVSIYLKTVTSLKFCTQDTCLKVICSVRHCRINPKTGTDAPRKVGDTTFRGAETDSFLQ